MFLILFCVFVISVSDTTALTNMFWLDSTGLDELKLFALLLFPNKETEGVAGFEVAELAEGAEPLTEPPNGGAFFSTV